jgi:uncharacterized protein (DUF1810 family)
MVAPDDPHDLERFVAAQAADHATALAELRAGRKRTHWMWYVLPQLRGLGTSPMAWRYGLAGLDEARAYLAHPLLGPRLLEGVAALNAHEGLSATAILGEVDALKLRSCLTLFMQVAPPGSPFEAALAKYFGGVADPATLALLGRPAPAPGGAS